MSNMVSVTSKYFKVAAKILQDTAFGKDHAPSKVILFCF